jgi:hypothetical protein
MRAAFYCVADDRYFLGAVGLVNSLRLVGHTEPVFVLDCGLGSQERELVSEEATLVPAPSEAPPWLLKTVAPLRHPAEVMVLIDADVVVTRSLAEIVEAAAAGRVVAVENDRQRFVPEWGELLGLGSPRRQPYVSSGLVAVDRTLGRDVLALMDELRDRVDFELTFWRRNVPDYPFLYADQDVLNAILACRVARERLLALEHRLAPTPPFRGLRVVDETALRCRYGDGVEPLAVHHFATKPWLEPTHHGVYSRLLRRLLVGPDVALRVAPERLPLRLRTGLRAYADRKRVNAGQHFRWYVREPLAARIGRRRRDPEAERGGEER